MSEGEAMEKDRYVNALKKIDEHRERAICCIEEFNHHQEQAMRMIERLQEDLQKWQEEIVNSTAS